jgi:hypothetical protein
MNILVLSYLYCSIAVGRFLNRDAPRSDDVPSVADGRQNITASASRFHRTVI